MATAPAAKHGHGPYLCPDCSTTVQWTTTKAGKRYLANVGDYGRGYRRFRGPHTAERCAQVAARLAESLEQHARYARTQRAMTIMHRWTMVYGDEFRAWAAEDQPAAAAHYETLTARLGLW